MNLASFHQHGFVRLGSLLAGAQLDAMVHEERKFRDEALRGRPAETVQSIFVGRLAPRSAVVRDFVLHGPHVTMLSTLIGPNVSLARDQFVVKLPDRGNDDSDFPWHQDDGYGHIEPTTDVTVWVALEAVNEQNGCLWIVPGSHRRGLLRHARVLPESVFKAVDVEDVGQPIVLAAGEAVAMSGLVLHCSRPNRTPLPRAAFFARYAETRARRVRENRSILDDPGALVVIDSR